MGSVFSPSVENLVAQLSRLPGVGSRAAQRLYVHHNTVVASPGGVQAFDNSTISR